MLQVFQNAIPVIETIERAGFEAYFVGGSIRDYILDRPIHDIDIATSATPQEVKSLFRHTIDIGIEHGTVLVIYNGNQYEITTFRTESSYKDFRRPDHVEYVRSLELDLQRRDFTMNAIAMDKKGKFIDPFAGYEAISQKVIVTVGNANERFREDALRMMRAIRFVSQLVFTLNEETKQAIYQDAHLLQHISVERITLEFTKLLNGSNKYQALALLSETGLITYMPGIKGKEKQFQTNVIQAVNDLTENQVWLYLLAVLNIDDPGSFLKEWRLPSKKVKYLTRNYECLMLRKTQPWNKIMLYDAGKETAIDVEKVFRTLKGQSIERVEQEVSIDYQQLAITSREQINVTGKDLMEWFEVKGGPWIKETLRTIEVAILHKEVGPNKQEIKEWLQRCNLQQGKKY